MTLKIGLGIHLLLVKNYGQHFWRVRGLVFVTISNDQKQFRLRLFHILNYFHTFLYF